MNTSRLLILFFFLNSTCDKQRHDMSGQAASIMSTYIISCVQDGGNHLRVRKKCRSLNWGKEGWGKGRNFSRVQDYFLFPEQMASPPTIR